MATPIQFPALVVLNNGSLIVSGQQQSQPGRQGQAQPADTGGTKIDKRNSLTFKVLINDEAKDNANQNFQYGKIEVNNVPLEVARAFECGEDVKVTIELISQEGKDTK